MTDRQHGRTRQLTLVEKILWSPLILLIYAWVYWTEKSLRRAQRRERKKCERAKQRSSGIEDWSEVKNNDDWR